MNDTTTPASVGEGGFDHRHTACRDSGEWLTDQETKWMLEWSDRTAPIAVFGALIRLRADFSCQAGSLAAAREEARRARASSIEWQNILTETEAERDQATARVAALEGALQDAIETARFNEERTRTPAYRAEWQDAAERWSAALAPSAGGAGMGENREHVLRTDCWCQPHVEAYGEAPTP